ncbi:BRO-N domain-containing protein [Mediterraneibacter gnavus]|jgi:prophage antirepressor-like protein|uniref:BRO-N domain-containing protein n=1 Tax=Mediterraneibacter gnavus TaxID=33038 RepID=UPI001FAB979D|nr:BRO family protein [Mediterraneibacter gnavus]
MNELKIFENEEFGQVRTIVINNEPWFVGKDVATALGYANPKNAVPKHVSDEDKLSTQIEYAGQRRTVTVINESGLYALIFGSKLESAKRFKHWVTNEVLPTIRKTGGYVNNDELFINTYLPFADDATKMLFSSTLETVRKQNDLIKKQKDEILHQKEVITGLTDDVDIYKKRSIINRICKRRQGNYANRYKELYKCFRESYHVDLEARCEGFNLRQNKKKDKLTTIAYAEQFGFIDDLFECCAKLYETEVKEVLNQMIEAQ